MSRLTCVLALLLFVGAAHAGDSLVGKVPPALNAEAWLAEAEGTTLEALHGRVVVLLWGGACDLSDADSVTRWNDVRAGYLENLRVVLVVPKGTTELPKTVEFTVAAGSEAYGDTTPRALLIAADGKVAWEGAPSDLPEDLVAKLVRKAKLLHIKRVDGSADPVASAFRKGQFPVAREVAKTMPDHEDVTHVTNRIEALLSYWKRQVERSRAANNPAETALFLKWIARYMKGTPEGTDAGEKCKALKGDKTAAKDIKGASAYGKLRVDLSKTKGKRKKLDALVKKAERAAKSYAGTPSAERAQRLADRLKADPAIEALQEFIRKEKINTTSSSWRIDLPRPPQVTFAKKRKYYWHLKTNQGDMTLHLFPDAAPMHVSSILYLTELGYFDGLIFHRVIPGFMAQGGCPTGTGTGTPGYKFHGEFASGLKHDKVGILSAAHSGPGTDGSQFFITFGPAPHLDGKHTVYGVLVKGEDTLRKIEKLGTKGGPTTRRVELEQATYSIE